MQPARQASALNANVASASINEVRIVSIPSGQYFNSAELQKIEQGQSPIDALQKLERLEEPARCEEPAVPLVEHPDDFVPQTERERRLLAELEALSPEALLERAKAAGFVDADSG